MNNSPTISWTAKVRGQQMILLPVGEWVLANYDKISRTLQDPVAQSASSSPPKWVLSGEGLTALDTAGADLLFRLANRLGIDLKDISLVDLKDEHASVLALTWERAELTLPPPRKPSGFLAQVGSSTLDISRDIVAMISFLGMTAITILEAARRPSRLRWKDIFVQLERVLVDAIPVICLVTMLIGVVVSYLFAIQLMKYGAHLFVVDGSAMALTRELSPIIVALVAAGRTGSAFTAQIGAMKINEEVDAMHTLGLSPMHVLVLPRIIALMFAMPLLVFVGDLVGLFGTLLVAKYYAGIEPSTFLMRLQFNYPIMSGYIGLIKAPVFAFFIAMIGCRKGLSVDNNATSLGLNTTSTVVQSIVVVIIINAIYAIIFARVGFWRS